jgi:hypothetical protein
MERKMNKLKMMSDANSGDFVESAARPNKFSRVLSFLLNFLLAAIIIGGLYYFISSNPAKADDAQVLARLKTIILLPDTVPTMAIITNADILKSQQPGFFANAKNGDRLIIYPDLAIIYDYSANKIIKIGPVQNIPASTLQKPK